MTALEIAAWLVAGGAALFVASEFVVRAWLARFGRYYIWEPFARTRMELDRDVLPDLEPVTETEANGDGERGDPPPSDWRNAYRVLIAGGSVAECYFVDQRTSWPYVVQTALNRPDNLAALGVERVHVGNVARSLVTCRHIDRMLERVLDRYPRLDAVVFMVGASDLVHWLEQRTPPVLDESIPSAAAVFSMHPEGPFGWSPKTLALRRIASYWRRRLLRPLEVRQRAGKRLGEARAMRARCTDIVREAPDPAPLLDHFEKYLRRMIARARARGIRVVVARQPWLEKQFTPQERKLLWNFGAGRPYSGEVKTYYDHELVWRLLKLVDRRVVDIARDTNVEEIEIASRLESNFENYYDELHHTAKGCAVIGEAVAQAIVRGHREAGKNGGSTTAARAAQQSHAQMT